MLFRLCCVAPPAHAPSQKDIPTSSSSPQTTANTQQKRITEDEKKVSDDHHSLHKMFSRDAMPLDNVPTTTTTPPLPGRLFSRDVINIPSPMRLNRFFSRGAMEEESTPRNSSRKLLATILDSKNDEDDEFENVHQVFDANVILDAIAEHVQSKQHEAVVLLERTVTFPGEFINSTGFSAVFELHASQELLNMASAVEITSLHLAPSNSSPITVYSTSNLEGMTWENIEKEHNVVVDNNGLLVVQGPIDLTQPCLLYISNSTTKPIPNPHYQRQLSQDLIQVKCLEINNNNNGDMGFPFVSASLRLQTMLWSADTHHRFPTKFKLAVRTLVLCNAQKLHLPNDTVLFRLFAMLPYDWF